MGKQSLLSPATAQARIRVRGPLFLIPPLGPLPFRHLWPILSICYKCVIWEYFFKASFTCVGLILAQFVRFDDKMHPMQVYGISPKNSDSKKIHKWHLYTIALCIFFFVCATMFVWPNPCTSRGHGCLSWCVFNFFFLLCSSFSLTPASTRAEPATRTCTRVYM